MRAQGKITITVLSATLVLAVTAVIFVAVRSRDRDGETSAVSITYDNGMLTVSTASYPADIILCHDGNAEQAMAYRLAKGPEQLPPVYGDGKYTAFIMDKETYTASASCMATASDPVGQYLKPTMSMAGCFSLLPTDLGEDRSLEGITKVFVDAFDYSDEPNEGAHSPYSPDVWHTRGLRHGACADLSALYAAYLRSAGIPAKVVYGDRTSLNSISEAHAWTEVHVDGEWKIVDISALCWKKDCTELFADDGRYSDRYCIY